MTFASFLSTASNFLSSGFSLCLCSVCRWLNPLLRKGYKRELQIKDLYTVLRSDASGRLSSDLDRYLFCECRPSRDE